MAENQSYRSRPDARKKGHRSSHASSNVHQTRREYTNDSNPSTSNAQESSYEVPATYRPVVDQHNTTDSIPQASQYSTNYGSYGINQTSPTYTDNSNPSISGSNAHKSSYEAPAPYSVVNQYNTTVSIPQASQYSTNYGLLTDQNTTSASFPQTSHNNTSESQPYNSQASSVYRNEYNNSVTVSTSTTASSAFPPSYAPPPTVYPLKTKEIPDLAEEFISHIAAELRVGSYRSLLQQWIDHYCSSVERTVASEALQAVAKSVAQDFLARFWASVGEPLGREVETARTALWRSGLPDTELETRKQFRDYIGTFAVTNLSKFYPHGARDKRVEKIAENVVERNPSIKLPPELKPGLSKLALYDFVLFCDDSSSMKSEDRTPALQATVESVASFATILSPDGISIRLLNGHNDAAFDNLKTMDQVKRAMRKFKLDPGGTMLGTNLESKILKPMIIDKARDGTLKKPVIVNIITDGEPTNETRDTLRHKILYCKERMVWLGYDPATVVFLITRVGTSQDAIKFVEELSADDQIGSMIYASGKDLATKRSAFLRTNGEAGYTALLVQLFLAALQVTTH